MHTSGLDKWMDEENVRVCTLLKAMSAIDPIGSGVCRRTIYNARRLGTCDIRTLLMLIAASERLHGDDAVARPLTLEDFDQWSILS